MEHIKGVGWPFKNNFKDGSTTKGLLTSFSYILLWKGYLKIPTIMWKFAEEPRYLQET